MYSIGDLAQLAGVTPRMLRHYHELGILVPIEVDHRTGYRRYDETQLADLLQVLALKGLGFALTDIKRVIDGGVSTAELRGMLLLRRTELENELDEAAARLRRVEHQIHRLEDQMNNRPIRDLAVAGRRLPSAHLAVASGISPSFGPGSIGPVIQPLYPRLLECLQAAGVAILGPSLAYHDDLGEDGVGVHAGFPIDPTISDVPGLEVVDLPAVELAAVAIHHGDMDTVDVDTVSPLLDWIRDHGFRTTGFSRELYLSCPDDIAEWQTEVQFPIEPDPAT